MSIFKSTACSLGLIGLAFFASPATGVRADDPVPVQAPAVDMKALLSNTDIPLTIRLKDLDSRWRRFRIISSSSNAQLGLLMGGAGMDDTVHYTRGQTVEMGGVTYLIAYRVPSQIDPRAVNWRGHGEPPRPRTPADTTEMSLSLLNLRTVGGMGDLRPFNPARDMVNTEQANAASLRTLTLLGKGLARYVKARGVMPGLTNPVPWDANRVFYPYISDERLYQNPSTGDMYRYNTILVGKKTSHISDFKTMAVFYEGESGADGTRGVLFLDGHAERLNAERWKVIKRVSKIDDSDGADDDEAPKPAPPAAPASATHAPTSTPAPRRGF